MTTLHPPTPLTLPEVYAKLKVFSWFVSVARVLIRRIVSANQNCRICLHVVNKRNADVDSNISLEILRIGLFSLIFTQKRSSLAET